MRNGEFLFYFLFLIFPIFLPFTFFLFFLFYFIPFFLGYYLCFSCVSFSFVVFVMLLSIFLALSNRHLLNCILFQINILFCIEVLTNREFRVFLLTQCTFLIENLFC